MNKISTNTNFVIRWTRKAVYFVLNPFCIGSFLLAFFTFAYLYLDADNDTAEVQLVEFGVSAVPLGCAVILEIDMFTAEDYFVPVDFSEFEPRSRKPRRATDRLEETKGETIDFTVILKPRDQIYSDTGYSIPKEALAGLDDADAETECDKVSLSFRAEDRERLRVGLHHTTQKLEARTDSDSAEIVSTRGSSSLLEFPTETDLDRQIIRLRASDTSRVYFSLDQLQLTSARSWFSTSTKRKIVFKHRLAPDKGYGRYGIGADQIRIRPEQGNLVESYSENTITDLGFVYMDGQVRTSTRAFKPFWHELNLLAPVVFEVSDGSYDKSRKNVQQILLILTGVACSILAEGLIGLRRLVSNRKPGPD